MESDDIDKTLKRLDEQVSQFVSTNVESSSNSSIPTFNIRSSKLYLVFVPIIILIGLIMIKPGFITHEVSTDGNTPEIKISTRKMLIAIALLSIIIYIVMYFYIIRKKSM